VSARNSSSPGASDTTKRATTEAFCTSTTSTVREVSDDTKIRPVRGSSTRSTGRGSRLIRATSWNDDADTCTRAS
jgi:hypothetical protein